MNGHRNIVCFGDSITHAQAYAEGDRWTARLAFHLEAAQPGRFEVFNRGIGGNTTALGLDRIKNDVIPLLPGLVLIQFGINDAYVFPWAKIPRVSLSSYSENLQEILRQIRAAQGDAIIIINHPVTLGRERHPQGNGESIGANLAPYNRAAWDLAQREKLPTVNIPELLECEDIPMEEFWSEDCVHLSPRGNRLYARLVSSVLAETFEFSNESKAIE